MTRIATYPLRGHDLIPRAASAWLLILVHVVGGVGFVLNPGLFARLVPLHLLFCLAVWAFNQRTSPGTLGSIAWITCCGVLGFSAEVVGVKTSLLFGSYEYGAALGPTFADVPLMMVVNWSLLTAIVADVSAAVGDARSWGTWGKTTFGAAALVVLDLFLEPFAIAHDLWRWQNEQVPIQNYVGWAVVSFLLLLPFHALNLRPRNPVSGWLFVLLNAFFAVTLLAGASDP